MSQVEISLLMIGVADPVENVTVEKIAPTHTQKVQTCEEFMSFLESHGDQFFHFIVVGGTLNGITVSEIAQSLRGTFIETPIFYAHNSRNSGFDRTNFVKNGFTDAFLFPMDANEFSSVLETLLVELRNLRAYRSVKIIDIQPNEVLDFDLHVVLPINRKYVRYSAAGREIDLARAERLKSHNVGSLFVPLEQMQNFYAYSASKLKALAQEDGSGMSQTERSTRLQGAVRELMTGIFCTSDDTSFGDGKKMMEDAGEIVKSFLTQSKQSALYERINSTVGGAGGSYSHLSNVSTLAALFSMALGIGQPEDLALAGLFHDIGLSVVPVEIQSKATEERSEDERKTYEGHPEQSVNLVKAKKIVLPQNIQTFILQHHERIGGTGYPLKISEPKLKMESQILGLADEFDELTKIEFGKRALTPAEALMKLKEGGGFNLDLIDKLCGVLQAA